MKSKSNPNPNPVPNRGEEELEQTEVPLDFRPDGWNVAYARRRGLDIAYEVPAFMDLHGSKGTRALNWQGMFHQWLVRAADDHGRIRLPAWVPLDEWEGYLEARQYIGKTIRPSVQRWALKKLEELRDEGYDPTRVLEQSIARSYAGLYPPAD